jgi:hypothetical protein
MFRIDIQFKSFGPITGLQALDERRRLRLPDGASIVDALLRTRYVTVPEDFARKHFGRTDTEITREVPLELFQPGDCDLKQYGSIYIADDITDERIMQLWLMGTTVE